MASKKTSSAGKTSRTRPTIPASHAKKTSATGSSASRASSSRASSTRATGAGSVARTSAAAGPSAVRAAKATRAGAAKRVAGLIAAAKERGRAEDAVQEVKAKSAKVKAPPAPPTSLASDKARELAIQVATAALEKKAVGLEIIDVAGRVDYADFLVVMTGRSDRQVNALAQGIEDGLKKKGHRPMAVEGLPHASWVIMDYGDVVVHVFQDDARRLYDIEGLWMDAKRVPLPEEESLSRSPGGAPAR